MPEITNFRQGAILNHHHGTETATSLKVTLQGVADHSHPVYINGKPADMDGRSFSAEVELKEKFNTICAEEITPFGSYIQKLTLVWDKKSFKRYYFFIDDHSFVFTDLTKQRPAHAFDHFYLARLKKIHDLYGFKVTLNTFFHNDHEEFTLDKMPDIWKSEFADNSDWLKFSFHAKSEFPDRPYIESSAEEFGRDYDQVKNEIIRFAGERSFAAPVVMHWGNIHPAVAEELLRRGTTCLGNSMRPKIMGGPSLADRQKGGNMKSSEEKSENFMSENRSGAGDAFSIYYEPEEENAYLAKHSAYYDPLMKFFIRGRVACCCNLVALDQTENKIRCKMALNDKYGCDTLTLASHEQYSFPYYPNYLPDHLDRLETAARCATEAGYVPVDFNDGIMGNTAWDK